MKIAILTDSSSGLKHQSKKNVFVLPLPIIFPNQIIVEDCQENDSNQEKILNNLDTGVLKTSALNPGILEFKITELLKNYDYVIYLPIAYNLSNQYQISLTLLKNPELVNKLTIVKHFFTGIQLANFIDFILPSVENISNIKSLKLKQFIDYWEQKSLLSIVPGDISLLNKGGRVSKLMIKFAAKRNLKIMIIWSDKPKKLISKNYQNLISKYWINLEKHFNNSKEIIIYLAHTKNCSQELLDMYLKEFSKYKITVKFTNLPSIFAVHSGNNTVGIVAFEK